MRRLIVISVSVVCVVAGVWCLCSVRSRGTGHEPGWMSFSPVIGTNKLSRAEFAARINAIRETRFQELSTQNAIALLGKPDKIRRLDDTIAIGTETGVRAITNRQVLCYGTETNNVFPTLGSVTVGNGLVEWVSGGTTGIVPNLFSEMELRTILRVIDDVSQKKDDIDGASYDPLAIIRIVNRLQPLGKKRALAALSEYVQLQNECESSYGTYIFHVANLLFDLPVDPAYEAGATPWYSYSIGDRARAFRFPILLVDDVPFRCFTLVDVAGVLPTPGEYINALQAGVEFRRTLLRPPDNPLDALVKAERTITNSGLWSATIIGNFRCQLFRLLVTVYPTPYEWREGGQNGFWPGLWRNPSGMVCNATAEDKYKRREAAWTRATNDISRLSIRWDTASNMYTFDDGSILIGPLNR